MSTHYSYHDTLDGLCSWPPIIQDLGNLLALVRRKDDWTSEDGATLGVKLEDELCHDSKVGATSTDTPKEIGMLILVSGENMTVSRDDGVLARKYISVQYDNE